MPSTRAPHAPRYFAPNSAINSLRPNRNGHPQNTSIGFWLRPNSVEAIAHMGVTLLVLLLSIATFTISTLFGVLASFSMTLLLTIMIPAAAPVLLVTAFMFQNMGIAIFIPLMGDGAGFDAVRGLNFIILLSTFGTFVLAAFLHTNRLPDATRRWILLTLGVIGLIVLYLGLGAVRGDIKDALIYFRNTLTPLACFVIGLSVASLYRVTISKILLWLGLGAIAYGYAELFFTFDFLSLFNGDEYFYLRLAGQIESGYWDRILEQTGFVLRGLDDVMMVPFLNMHFFDQWFPRVFRLSGPNIHPISYAYALSVISAYMLFSKRAWLLVLSIPLLIIIGSKGALVLLLSAICLKIGTKMIGLRLSVIAMVMVLTAYIGAAIIYGRANGDYHVLGFLAGIRDFLRNPFGQGLGFGGNLSSSIKNVLSWTRAQNQGVADIPVESALGVMLYQMGIATFAYFAILVAIIRACYKMFLRSGNETFLFGIAAITTIIANSVLQEEAIYSPLALGLTLTMVGVLMGQYWYHQNNQTPKEQRRTHV